MAEELGDEPLLVITNFYLGLIFQSLGDLDRAADLFRRNRDIAQDAPSSRPFGVPAIAVLSCSQLSRSLIMLGRFEVGVATALLALEIAEAGGRTFEIAYACYALGSAHAHRGDFTKAIAVLERGLDICESWSFGLLLPLTACTLGYAGVLTGRTDWGMSLLQRSLDLTRARASAQQLVLFSEACVIAGRVGEAKTAADRVLELSRSRKERAWETWALYLVAQVAFDGDPTSPMVESGYRQAMTQAEALGLRPLLARCHLGLGRVHARRGAAEQGHLASAATLFDDLGMDYWLEQARAESKRSR